MGLLEKAKDISEIKQSNLWIIYGKSGSGKTHVLSTFPKPLLYVQFGDNGSSTIKNVEGIKVLQIENHEMLLTLYKELKSDKTYKTVAIDTFSLLVNEWIDENAIQKDKRVTMQMWGDLKTDTERLIRLSAELAKDRIVVLTCHEASDVLEGMEDEILPDIRPSVSKGARTYLEAMSNFGIHTVVKQKEKTNADGSTVIVKQYSAHIGANPFYWTKLQKPANIKSPSVIVNPSYSKIVSITNGTKEDIENV